jgi:formylglycine-generating enzyme required for sulfatase activity
MGHIFISYSHKDSSYVHKLAEALEKEGFEIWIDDRIHYGSEWPKVVTRNLDVSNGVIVVLSNNSNESDMVQNEVARAREKKKPIFPLLLDGENWLIVQAKQFVDVRDGSLPSEKFYERLALVAPRNKKEFPSVLPQKPNSRKVSIKPKTILEATGILTAILIVFWGLPWLINFIGQMRIPNPISTLRSESTSTLLAISTLVTETKTLTVEPIIIKTRTPSKTSVPELGIGSTQVSTTDGTTLVFVPSGIFTMGQDAYSARLECIQYSVKLQNDLCRANWFQDQSPAHTINLDDFWIDETEVTNAMYTMCVNAGICEPPRYNSSSKRTSYYNDPNYEDFPVLYVSWEDATMYCGWAGRRLPTEAEWEKAARGVNEFIYPWGNAAPSESLLNFNNIIGDTVAAKSYPKGASPYGALNMAGNVWEWVSDWYSPYYYEKSDTDNPQGPTSGSYRIMRGGSWSDNGGVVSKNVIVYDELPQHWQFTNKGKLTTVYLGGELTARTTFRFWSAPKSQFSFVGFRCVTSSPP